MSAAIQWRSIYKVISNWVLDTLSDQNAETFWENQNAQQPPYPYVSLLRTSVIREGFDETRTEFDPAAPAGEQFTSKVVGQRSFTLTAQAITADGKGKEDPDCDGVAMATTLQSSLGLASVKNNFAAIGLAIIEELPVQDLSVINNEKFDSRGVFDVRFRIASVLDEKGADYIAKTEIEKTNEPEFTVIVDAS